MLDANNALAKGSLCSVGEVYKHIKANKNPHTAKAELSRIFIHLKTIDVFLSKLYKNEKTNIDVAKYSILPYNGRGMSSVLAYICINVNVKPIKVISANSVVNTVFFNLFLWYLMIMLKNKFSDRVTYFSFNFLLYLNLFSH